MSKVYESSSVNCEKSFFIRVENEKAPIKYVYVTTRPAPLRRLLFVRPCLCWPLTVQIYKNASYCVI